MSAQSARHWLGLVDPRPRDRRPVVERQHLRPQRRVDRRRARITSSIDLLLHVQPERQAVAQLLARIAEPRPHDAEERVERHVDARLPAHVDAHDGRLHLRRRLERAGRHLHHHAACHRTPASRRSAAPSRPGFATIASATSSCTITTSRRGAHVALEEAAQHRRGDVVRQVRDDDVRRRARRRAPAARPACAPARPPRRSSRARVREPVPQQSAARSRSTSTATTRVARCGEHRRQRAAPRPDLEHGIAGRELRRIDDAVQDVGVGEEVLSEALLRRAAARVAPYERM